jgi:hypothetical protein
MTTYSTPFKAGTIAAFSGTSLTVAGFTPDAGDVGRLVIIRTGNARLQHREITAVSGQVLTVAHAWDTNPFVDTSLDQRGSDVLPSMGDSVCLSYNVTDLIAGDPDMTLANNRDLLLTGILTTTGGAYLHFRNLNVTLRYDNIRVGTDSGIIFGYYSYFAGQDGYPKQVCNIVETAGLQTATNGRRSAGTDFGLIDQYGGSFTCASTGFFFIRAQRGISLDDSQFRMMFVDTYGNFGGRVEGNRSMVVATGQGSANNVGWANFLSSVARVELEVVDSFQGNFVNTNLGPNGRSVFTRLSNITGRLFRVLTVVTGDAGVIEFTGKKSEIDALPLVAQVEGPGAAGHLLRYGNLVRPTFANPDLSAVTGNITTRLVDGTGALVNSQNLTTGRFAEFFARHTDIVSTVGDKTLGSGTFFGPYSLRAVKYGKQFSATTISAEDTFDAVVTMLDDPLITQPVQATVDAYTTLDTPQEWYDYAVSWLEANITTKDRFIVTRIGDTINAGALNVVIDASAAQVLAFDGTTVTIRATAFTGNITTTGVVTTANGAAVVGGIIDANGDSFLSFDGADSWIVYPTAAARAAETGALGSGTGAQIYRFTFAPGTSYFVTLVQSGTQIRQDVTPTASGETVVSISTAGLIAVVSNQLGNIPPEIFVNSDAAVNGNGKSTTPFNNLDDAITLARSSGTARISVRGATPVFPLQSCAGLAISATSANSVLSLNGQNFSGARVENFLVAGGMTGNDAKFKECGFVMPTSGMSGWIEDCFIQADMACNGQILIDDCRGVGIGAPVTISAANSATNIALRASAGAFKLGGLTGGTHSVDSLSGAIEVLASCTGGALRISGAAQVTDNSAGTAVTATTTATRGQIAVVNDGVKLASRIIPHSADLP